MTAFRPRDDDDGAPKGFRFTATFDRKEETPTDIVRRVSKETERKIIEIFRSSEVSK